MVWGHIDVTIPPVCSQTPRCAVTLGELDDSLSGDDFEAEQEGAQVADPRRSVLVGGKPTSLSDITEVCQ